jgi:hypothetical protein
LVVTEQAGSEARAAQGAAGEAAVGAKRSGERRRTAPPSAALAANGAAAAAPRRPNTLPSEEARAPAAAAGSARPSMASAVVGFVAARSSAARAPTGKQAP